MLGFCLILSKEIIEHHGAGKKAVSYTHLAYDVIVLDENHREIVRHPRLYGKRRQESMDWLPYLNQLARRPSALKYTGIYDLLPEKVRSFLDKCDARGKGKTLKVLAALSRETDFTRAAEALELSLIHI